MRRIGIVKMTKIFRTLSLSAVLAAQLPVALAASRMQPTTPQKINFKRI